MNLHHPKRRRFLILLALSAVAPGCATTQLVSDPARNRISVVTINDAVTKPPAIYYLGPGGAVGLMFGAIGGALAAPGIEKDRMTFQQFVEKTGVSIENIARQEIEAAIRQSGKLAVADKPQPGAGTVRISVFQYGFSIPHGFSSMLVPILGIQCEVADASGKVLWSARDRLLTLGNPVEPVTPEAIRDDPKVMEKSWRAAARHIAASLVKEY